MSFITILVIWLVVSIVVGLFVGKLLSLQDPEDS